MSLLAGWHSLCYLIWAKGGPMIDQEGTTLLEYLLAVIVIIAVSIALIHPGITAYLAPY